MNFAGVHKLPVIFVCENNQYAIIGALASKQCAVTDVSVRAQGYGFPGVTVDGNDVLAVYGAAKEAVERGRRGEGPTFIEAKTYRLVPHTSDDDDRRYRTARRWRSGRRRTRSIALRGPGLRSTASRTPRRQHRGLQRECAGGRRSDGVRGERRRRLSRSSASDGTCSWRRKVSDG